MDRRCVEAGAAGAWEEERRWGGGRKAEAVAVEEAWDTKEKRGVRWGGEGRWEGRGEAPERRRRHCSACAMLGQGPC